MFELVINIVFIISGIGLAVIPLIWDIRQDAPVNIKSSIQINIGRKVFTKMGKVFIVVMALTVASGTIKFVIDNNTTTRVQEGITSLRVAHANDSMLRLADKKDLIIQELNRVKQVSGVEKKVDSTKAILNEKNFKYENLSLKLDLAQKENVQLQRQINSPFVEEYPYEKDSLNPHLIVDSARGLYNFLIYYANTGMGKAINLRSKTYFLGVKNNQVFVIDSLCGYYDDTTTAMSEKIPFQYTARLDINDRRVVLLAYELKYQNIFKQEKDPYRRVFVFNKDFINKNIPKLTKDLVKSVHSYLIQNHYWRN